MQTNSIETEARGETKINGQYMPKLDLSVCALTSAVLLITDHQAPLALCRSLSPR